MIDNEMTKQAAKRTKRIEFKKREWYVLRSILSNANWALFYMLIGGREAGKSYAVTDFYVGQWKKYKRPFYWLRLSDKSAQNLLMNNAEKLIDPDLKRKYNIELKTKGCNVYQVIRDDDGNVIKKELMARVLSLATFYNDKGSGFFDKDFLKDKKMYYNICLDEMNREKNEKNSFDIVYAFTNQLENLIRSTKNKVRIICIGNTLEEASDIMCTFNFLPEEFGRYKLKKKRCIVEYIEPSETYKNRRKGTIADILMPTASTFTNQIITDNSLVYTGRLMHPTYIVMFDKDTKFTIWDSNVVKEYCNEKCKVIAMRPYIDALFRADIRDNIIELFDTRSLMYHNLITFKKFQKEISLLKPRK